MTVFDLCLKVMIVKTGSPDHRVDVSQRWSRNLRRLVAIHPLTLKFAAIASRCVNNWRQRREFRSRMNKINPQQYIDLSHKPNLNVVILTIDCLGSEHLSCQGYFRQTTPFLDSLRPKFTAISASPWTYPSVSSIMTGLYPHNHGAYIKGKIKNFDNLENFQSLSSNVLTLPEILFLLGYKVYFGSAIGTAVYPLKGRVVPEVYTPPLRAENLLGNLAKWIHRNKGGKLFTYVQLGDLHQPLNPPEKYRNIFGHVKNLPNIAMWDFRRPAEQKGNTEKFREYMENRRLLYDNTLRYVDSAIERFYDSLKAAKLIDSTILVVTADHGEEFWEHAELEAQGFYDPRGYYGVGHGHSVFKETIEVPLLFSGPVPAIEPDHLVSTVDIVPTIIDLLGIRHKMKLDGRNVFNSEVERSLLCEACGYGYEKKALIVNKYKLVYSRDDGIEWLFDLENDPTEENPILDKELTSMFVKKLVDMLQVNEKEKVREVVKKRRL